MVSFSSLPVLIPKYHSLPKRRHAYCCFACHLVRLNKWHLYFYPSSDTLVRFRYVLIQFRSFRSPFLLFLLRFQSFPLFFEALTHLDLSGEYLATISFSGPYHGRNSSKTNTPASRQSSESISLGRGSFSFSFIV